MVGRGPIENISRSVREERGFNNPSTLNLSTPNSILQSYIYPHAYSVIVAHEDPAITSWGYSLTTYQAQLKAAVRQGDILLYDGWFTYGNPDIGDVITSYGP